MGGILALLAQTKSIMSHPHLIQRASALLLVVFALTACDKAPAPSSGQAPVAKTPGETVKAFYAALNEGRYPEAKAMLAKEALDALNASAGQEKGGLKDIADNATKGGTISTVDIVSEQVQGDAATVVVNIRFKDGTAEENAKNGLKQVGGSWFITGGE